MKRPAIIRLRRAGLGDNIGYDALEVIAFNYDGKGSALFRTYSNGHISINAYSDSDLDYILGFGEETPYAEID